MIAKSNAKPTRAIQLKKGTYKPL